MADERISLSLDVENSALLDAIDKLGDQLPGLDAEIKETTEFSRALERAFSEMTAAEAEAAKTAEVRSRQAEESARRMEEERRLVLDLVKAKEAERTTVLSTANTYDVLDRQVGEYEVQERRVVETTKVQTTMLHQLGIELEKSVGLNQVVTTEMAAMGRAASGAVGTRTMGGQGLLGVSYAVQDFTSMLQGGQGLSGALRAVQNNIPMLVMAMGVGGGLAGTVSLVALGVGALIDNWGSIQKLWKSGDTEEEAARMKKLADETQHAAEAAERLLKTKSPEHREAAANVRKAVETFGAEAVVKELMEALKTRGDLGPAGNRGAAETLIANLLQGNRNAVELLGELPLRGAVGRVLGGGPTPREERARHAANERRQTEMERRAEEAQRKREQAQRDEERKAAREADEFNAKLQRQQREATPEERRAADAQLKKMRDAEALAKERAANQQQVQALQLQQRLANPNAFGTDRQQAAAMRQLQGLQKALGERFPNLMSQTFENQQRLAAILKDLERKGSRTAHEIRQAQQHMQPQLNMGAPF